MTEQQKSNFKLDALLSDLLDGTISAEDFVTLDRQLRSNPNLLAKYCEHLTLVHGLRKYSRRTASTINDVTNRSELGEYCSFQEVVEKDLEESAIRRAIKALEKEEKHLRDEFSPKPIHNRRVPTQREVIITILKIAAVITLATSIIWLDRQLWKHVGQSTTVQSVQSTQPVQPLSTVAMVTDVMGMLSIEDSSTACQTGDKLYPKAFDLESFGFAALTFDNGTRIVLEGPARFELIGAKTMILTKGKLFAQVPGRASGFTVKGPAANVVDLGTEFGLQTDGDGTSRVYTYKGKVSVTGHYQGQLIGNQIVSAGQAQKVSGNNGEIGTISFEPERFARQIDSHRGFVWRGQSLDLADVVGGGNGFGTGQTDTSISMEGGTFRYYGHTRDRRDTYDGQFTQVPQSPYIDGIFVPDGRAKPMIVTSQGHPFRECPETSGTMFEDIFNGAYTGRISFDSGENIYRHHLILDGQSYGTTAHPAITVHSNSGITFDLNAIRADCPIMRHARFEAMCGISEDQELALIHPDNTADLWVLVDGKIRFEARNLRSGMPGREIRIELTPEDHFLTFACTEGEQGPNWDWAFFAEPRLEAITP